MNRFRSWKKPVFDEDGWAYPDYFCKQHKIHQYGWRCQYPDELKLGKNVDIGCFTYINAKYGVEIGDNVQIGSHCSIYSEDTERGVKGRVVIEDDVLIGAHTVILPGAHIKKGSKIPIGSVIRGEHEKPL